MRLSASLLACNLVNPCLGREPKARVTTIPIILCVDQVDISITSNNIFVLMLKFCWNRDGGIRGKLVNMNCDGLNVFQGHQTSVTLQLIEKVAFF